METICTCNTTSIRALNPTHIVVAIGVRLVRNRLVKSHSAAIRADKTSGRLISTHLAE